MVWQRAGTVSAQNGSTTVTGAGVDFAASSRVGDSFVGPDGATYEVSNVASSTVISILPAYKGPTVSGAGYAIMPVQGYDKTLSDAFNNLINQFGLKLAALGTTGNYETLPFNKGGTGANSKEEAQAALEIPTAAALLPLNKGGTGANSKEEVQAALDIPTAAALLAVARGGTGNNTGTASKLAAAAIVGTATQAAGVPTGAIIEHVELSSGNYVRFACGTMWCYRNALEDLKATIALGSLFVSAAASNFTFPKAFVGIPSVIPVGAAYATSIGWAAMDSQPTAATTGSIKWLSPVSGSSGYVGYLAIGRWY